MKKTNVIRPISLALLVVLLSGLDWDSISPTANYATVLSDLETRDEHTATLDYTGDTNLVTGTIRKNSSTKKLEEWDGDSWELLSWHSTIDGHIADTDLHSGVPVGTILEDAGASTPTGFLPCNGSAVSRTTYSALFARIGTTYGTGDGSTTFNVPDRRGRFGLGKAASGTGSVLGSTGGALDHVHSLPGHYHGMGTGADLNITSSGGGGTVNIDHGHTASGSASSEGHHGHNVFETAQHGHTVFVAAGAGGTYFGLAQTFGGTGINISTTTNDSPIQCDGAGTHTHTISVSVNNLSGSNKTLPSHTHPAGNFAGNIGLVTGGSNGNTAYNSLGANPPYIALNYIIKY